VKVARTVLRGGKCRKAPTYPEPSVLLHGRTAANWFLPVVVGINVDEQQLVIITTYEAEALLWADNFSRRIA